TFSHIHAITEGWSYHTLLMELLECYRSLRGGHGLPAYEVPAVRYADFIAAEQASLADPGDQSFWQDVVGSHSPFALPASWAAPEEAPREREHVRVPYSDLEEGLRRLATEARTSLKSVLVAAHLKVLGMLTAEEAFHTGVVYHGRLEAPGADRVLGMHLNTLPFPVVKGARTWRELVEQVYRQETEIWARRRYPLPAIQRAAGGSGDLLSVLFEYLDFHQVDTDSIDAEATMGAGGNEFGLNVICRAGHVKLSCPNDVIDGGHLDRLGGMYRSVLEAMASDVDGDARGVFLSEAERGLLLGAWAQGGTAVWPGGLVVDRFEAQAVATPDAVAVVVA
ncbi:condensation domain-containing protein, partial [Streptomyces sp. NPDC060000]|uniref:condensation domain-containing protein n=1 Tax=Streptomyces sp. NPDC060000 TaxID=3347031 RepID=UPI0036891E4F